MKLGRTRIQEAQLGVDEKLLELADTEEQQKECQARLQKLLRHAAAEEGAEAVLALEVRENDRAVSAMVRET